MNMLIHDEVQLVVIGLGCLTWKEYAAQWVMVETFPI